MNADLRRIARQYRDAHEAELFAVGALKRGMGLVNKQEARREALALGYTMDDVEDAIAGIEVEEEMK